MGKDPRLTTDHVITVHVDNGGVGDVAIHGHTDAGTISLVLVVDENSCEDSVGRSQRGKDRRQTGEDSCGAHDG